MKYKFRNKVDKIPTKQIPSYTQKIKNLLEISFPDKEWEDDFLKRKAEELYLSEKRM